uniref:G_PROTEIN_RECEP_F1_2 domain-containing protein n=2 Tax=Bursaphelenchus xylophilus TaxID=6326 RepID=A0A1I7RMU4_BURXY
MQNYSEKEELQLELHAPTSISPLRIFLSATCVFGIAFNVLVFCKGNRTNKRQASTTRISLRLLALMAMADTISLGALLLMLSIQYLGLRNPQTMTVVCKIDLFLIHAASAFSIWCWLVMSAIRYIAIYRPYAHLRLNKEPMFAVATVVLMCGLFEAWILFDVKFDVRARGCVETLPEEWGFRIQLAEITWSYFLPLVLITVLDFRVLCCHSVWKSRGPSSISDFDPAFTDAQCHRPSKPATSDETQALYIKTVHSTDSIPKPAYSPSNNSLDKCDSPQNPLAMPLCNPCTPSLSVKSKTSLSARNAKPRSHRRAQQIRILKRCLCISVLDLGMNLPNYLLRLYFTMADISTVEKIANEAWFAFFQDLSQMLYFAQFALNALYLMGIIYQAPRKKNMNNGNATSGVSKSGVWQ